MNKFFGLLVVVGLVVGCSSDPNGDPNVEESTGTVEAAAKAKPPPPPPDSGTSNICTSGDGQCINKFPNMGCYMIDYPLGGKCWQQSPGYCLCIPQ